MACPGCRCRCRCRRPAGWTPARLGASLLTWARGDDPGRVIVSFEYASLPDRGTWGGQYTGAPVAGTARPTESPVFTLPAPGYGPSGPNARAMRASSSAAQAAILSQPVESVVAGAFCLNAVEAGARFIHLTGVGASLAIVAWNLLVNGGALQARIYNGGGAAASVLSSSFPVPTFTRASYLFRKRPIGGGNVQWELWYQFGPGAVTLGQTANTTVPLSAASPTTTLTLGYTSSANLFTGAGAEHFAANVWDVPIDDVFGYLQRWQT